MKTLLITITYCQIFLMGLMGGYSYLLYKQSERTDQCIREILDSNTKLKDHFGHKIDTKDIWSHSEAYVTFRYFFCMNRRDR